jgi:hypothetical protein
MIGKKNIVFGFIYLVFTAALGPYMIQFLMPDIGPAAQTKKQNVGYIEQLAGGGFDNPETLEPLTGAEIAKANTKAILSLNTLENAQMPVEEMKSGPHAHGNLEAVLNIIAGLTLCFLAAPVMVKQLISWLFIAGALLHSGMLYLRVFDVAFANKLLFLGPWFVLAALLVLGISAAIWLRPAVVDDKA